VLGCLPIQQDCLDVTVIALAVYLTQDYFSWISIDLMPPLCYCELRENGQEASFQEIYSSHNNLASNIPCGYLAFPLPPHRRGLFFIMSGFSRQIHR